MNGYVIRLGVHGDTICGERDLLGDLDLLAGDADCLRTRTVGDMLLLSPLKDLKDDPDLPDDPDLSDLLKLLLRDLLRAKDLLSDLVKDLLRDLLMLLSRLLPLLPLLSPGKMLMILLTLPPTLTFPRFLT